MANDPIIRKFTLADIEKYHKGLLSPREMHDLEKAALDDPFLAEAMEGFIVPGINASTDLEELQQRLANRIEEEKRSAPIVPITKHRSNWWKIAAMIVAILGAGLVVYQLAFRKSAVDIAEMNQKRPGSSVNAPDDSAKGDNPKETAGAATTPSTDYKKLATDSQSAEENKSVANSGSKQRKEMPHDTVRANETVVFIPVDKNAKAENIQSSENVAAKSSVREQNMKTTEPGKPVQAQPNLSQKDETLVLNEAKEKTLAAGRKNYANAAPFNSNIFRGRVTDSAGNPLPFANITNTADNIGTYSDAKGYFLLTSPDSILNVQVRSLGFVNSNTHIRNNINTNQVILQEDRNSLSEVVISNKKLNSARSRNSNMVLDEPEPADGWNNYDTYLANNVNIPETFRTKQTSGGEVELSFDVNKEGEPVNIRIEKSLCETCDKEAIRLVKEGPKWKRKGKKGRTSVTISF